MNLNDNMPQDVVTELFKEGLELSNSEIEEVSSLPPFEEMVTLLANAAIETRESYDPEPVISPYTYSCIKKEYTTEQIIKIDELIQKLDIRVAEPTHFNYLAFERVHVPSSNKFPLPHRATPFSAGYDFYLPKDVSIYPGEVKRIWTGVRCVMPTNLKLWLDVRLRSSLAPFLELCGSGVIDSDYAYNEKTMGDIAFTVCGRAKAGHRIYPAGTRIGQGIIMPYTKVACDVPGNFERMGGHGSTGI